MKLVLLKELAIIANIVSSPCVKLVAKSLFRL